tara:strand:- start:46042 stop:47352 length:1311 start_codon:yes stop_codon:yes gene_type:complete
MPAKKKATKTVRKKNASVVKAESIESLMSKAEGAREKNANLLERVRKDPELAKKVKARLCKDLRRVYAIPRELLGPSASRDRYREHGYFSTSLVTYLFGLWAEFQRAADIKESLGVRKVMNNISKTARAQSTAEYAAQNVKPWDGAYNSLDLGKESLLFQIGSDFHGSSLIDPFARRVWMDIAKSEQPDAVRYNGDVVDFPRLSRHRQLPGHFALNLQQEIDGAVKIMSDTRDAAPNADHKFIMGNHDIRLVTALADCAPIFSSLRDLRFARLFKLDELEIGLVCRSNFLNPSAAHLKKDIAQNWETIDNLFTIVHGFLCGKDSASKHLRRFMRYGTNGHLHNPAMVSEGSDATGVIQWWQTGCMANPEAVAAEYIPGPIDATGWHSGFLMARVFPKHRFVTADYVQVGSEIATYQGRVWKITAKERAARLAQLVI